MKICIHIEVDKFSRRFYAENSILTNMYYASKPALSNAHFLQIEILCCDVMHTTHGTLYRQRDILPVH
jgi:hypothetical protein